MEGLLEDGRLRVLALFDKPDPLEGPHFEETIYLTPSRLDAAVRHEIADTVGRAAAALGLRLGPVHAEARINEAGVWIVEVAARSIGFVGKLIAEAIEEVDHGTVEAIEATGASRLQVLLIGVVPQVLPVVFGTIVYRWDINIRESTVLGFVGAGGIGIQLYASINQFAWQEVSVMLLAVFGVVLVSEFVSATVRSRMT